MTTSLIGYTGFVGTTLRSQTVFDACYNSANIEEIRGQGYDLVICAGAPAVKWLANQKPQEDLANLNRLIDNLRKLEAERFILISTVDVYKTPQAVDETSPAEASEPYGKHRRLLEKFVQEHFAQASIIRLPGLFGSGLKKNLIYDLLNNNQLDLTHSQSVFQFYNMENLWHDIQVVLKHSLPLVNFATEPVKAQEVALKCFGINFTSTTEKPPVYYDMQSGLASFFGESSSYLYSAEYTFQHIRELAAKMKELNNP